MLSRCIARTVAILGIAVSAGSASAQDAVKIGMVMPMTGGLASAGQQVVAGARLYIKQHGDTVAGKKIELIVKDDATSAETGKRLIQELVVNDKVDVIGGGLTADLLPSASLLTEARKGRDEANVVDLMDALKRSLGQARPRAKVKRSTARRAGAA